jgi:hypothetical protein
MKSKMWRSAFIILWLSGTPALAAQARSVMRVGIVITAAAQTTARKAVAKRNGERAVAGAFGGARAAALRPRGGSQARRHGERNLRIEPEQSVRR